MKPSEPMPTLIATTCNAVRQSLEIFAENNPDCNGGELSGAVVSTLSQALQGALMEGATAGLEEYIQSHESTAETIQRDGKTYRFTTRSEKKFLTIFGEMPVVRRLYYHWAGGPAVVPLDEAWEMEGRFATPEVTEYVLLSASMLVPAEIEGLYAKMCPFKPSTGLVQDLINQDGAALGEVLNDPGLSRQARPVELPEDGTVSALAVSMDGANVLVRQPGDTRRRPAEKPGKRPAGKEGGKSCCYKNAMVGSISFYEQVEGVIDIATGTEAKLAQRMGSLYHARMPEARAPKFKAEFERSLREVESKLPEDVPKVLLMDGARGLWSYAEGTDLYDSYIKVVDFFHGAEHLSLLAEALFGKSEDRANKWYGKWLHKIKHEAGAVDAMLRSVARYRAAGNLPRSRLEELETQRTFFRRNKHRMNYAELVERGLPIGSGPVEAACKTVVKARFCQSGMRWSTEGGQNVMNLRVLHKSGHWDSAWQTYRNAGGYRNSSDPHSDLAAA